MARSPKYEGNLKEFISILENGWIHLQRTIKAAASITELRERLHARGYLITYRALEQMINGIPTGAGLLQSPVLLTLICELIPIDLNKVFSVNLKHQELAHLDEESIARIAQSVTIYLKNGTEKAKSSKSFRTRNTAPRESWVPKIISAATGYDKEIRAILSGKLLNQKDYSHFHEKLIKPFPGKNYMFKEFNFILTIQTFLEINNQSLGNRAMHREIVFFYYYILVVYGSLGIIQAYRTITTINDSLTSKNSPDLNKAPISTNNNQKLIESLQAQIKAIVEKLNTGKQIQGAPDIFAVLTQITAIWGTMIQPKEELKNQEIDGFDSLYLALGKQTTPIMRKIGFGLNTGEKWPLHIEQLIATLSTLSTQMFCLPKKENDEGSVGSEGEANNADNQTTKRVNQESFNISTGVNFPEGIKITYRLGRIPNSASSLQSENTTETKKEAPAHSLNKNENNATEIPRRKVVVVKKKKENE